MADELNLFRKFEYEFFKSKELYHQEATNFLERIGILVDEPVPVPLIYISVGSVSHITGQAVVEECAFSIQELLSEEELFDFVDAEYGNASFIVNMTSKLVAGTVF